MLLFNVYWISTAVQVIQAKVFRNQVNSLSEGELIKHLLELLEEIIGTVGCFSADDPSSKGFDHLQLLNHRIDVADAS